MDFVSFLDPANARTEDSGQARYIEVHDPRTANDDSGVFLRIHSWDDEGRGHPELDALIGRRVRVRIEPVD